MSQPVHRPPSVWITQLLLVLSVILWAIALLRDSLFRCASAAQLLRLNCPSSVTLDEFLINFFISILIGFTVWGLQQRQRYGQWLAVTFLMGTMVVGIASTPLPRALEVIYLSLIPSRVPLPNSLDACNHPFGDLTYFCGYDSYQALVLKISFDLLPSLMLGFLALRLLYSHAAKRYFHK